MGARTIILAKSAGFCFGVSRALATVEAAVSQGKKLATLGPLIHNEQVTNRLAEKGVRIISSPKEACSGETVVIRSHGVGRETENYLIEHKIPYIDATCPFVKKIQNIVSQKHAEGYQIVIIGDKTHPEVIGINGWCCNKGIILGKKEDINGVIWPQDKLCVVAQTTQSRDFWKFITDFIKNTCQNTLLFDTICNATNERQKEAGEIAQKSDVCIVIGGRHSSNTCKLYDICKSRCPETFHIERADELNGLSPSGAIIGMTAGASTPDWIIKEVLETMAETETESMAMDDASFAEAYEKSFKTLNTGDVVTGTVIAVTPTEVYVDLGYKSDGSIPVGELTDDPDLKPEDLVKVGDEIEVFVVRVNDVEGTVKLSKKKLDSIKGWKNIEEAAEADKILSGKVVDVVNGGVIVLSDGVRVFVPASQANDRYLSDLKVLLNKDVNFRILDINEKRRKVIGTIKAVLMEEKSKKQEAFWNTMEIGKTYQGVVKTLTPFGAFVDIGGVDGLVHISELSWKRIKHPSEVVAEGDVIETFILDANKETGKVSLGYKKAEDNPWEIAKTKFKVDDVVKATVLKVVPFGAFVELLPGVDGLIHISQIANKRIAKPSDELSVGQEVEAKIVEIDFEHKKIGLSIRALLAEPEEGQSEMVEQFNKEQNEAAAASQAAEEAATESEQSADAE